MTTELNQLEKWKVDKWGMFSASEMDVLLTGPRGKTNPDLFGDGAMSYIHKVTRQAFTTFNEEDDNAMSYAMKMGKANEPIAYGEYVKRTGFTMLQYFGGESPIFTKYCDHSGCSPDAVAFKTDGSASFGVELKAPQGDTHFDYIRFVRTQEELKEFDRKYYTQCQFAMIAHKCDLWHWASYNDFFPHKHKLHIVEILPDEEFQEKLLHRLTEAIKIKKQILEELNA